MTRRMYLVLLVVVSSVLGMLSLSTPKPKDIETDFSAERAFEDIKMIAQKPHTVEDQEALEEVRDYLVMRMDDIGLNPIIHTYAIENDEYDFSEVNNILGTIEGTSDSYILLMAHYDSSPAKRIGEEEGSLGAADDGYGISTILEVVNLIVQDQSLTKHNGIKVLITDGEDNEKQGIKAARQAAAKGIKIFVFGIGDIGGGPIPELDGSGGFKKDPQGKLVLSKLEEESLQEIASLTGGTYVRSVAGDLDLDILYFDGIKSRTRAREIPRVGD